MPIDRRSNKDLPLKKMISCWLDPHIYNSIQAYVDENGGTFSQAIRELLTHGINWYFFVKEQSKRAS
jgi:hypothetical protein